MGYAGEPGFNTQLKSPGLRQRIGQGNFRAVRMTNDSLMNSAGRNARPLVVAIIQYGVFIAVIFWLLDAAIGHYLNADPDALSRVPALGDGSGTRTLIAVLLAIASGASMPLLCRKERVASGSIDFQQRFDKLFESTFDAALLLGADGRIREANHTAATVFGGTVKSFENVPAGDMFVFVKVGDRQRIFDLHSLWEAKGIRKGEVVIAKAVGFDARAFPVELRLSRIEHAGESEFLMTLREMTSPGDAG